MTIIIMMMILCQFF